MPIYGQMARSPMVLMLLGPLLGFVGHGYFSMFGAFWPSCSRRRPRDRPGLSYNAGRGWRCAPYTIGALATMPGVGIGLALGVTSAFFLWGRR